jgi:hypothetical protein
MNEQVENKDASFFPAFFYCTHMKKDGDRGRQRMKARVAWQARSDSSMATDDPLDRWWRGFWTGTGSEEKKVRAVVPSQLGRRGVRTHQQRGDAARLL